MVLRRSVEADRQGSSICTLFLMYYRGLIPAKLDFRVSLPYSPFSSPSPSLPSQGITRMRLSSSPPPQVFQKPPLSLDFTPWLPDRHALGRKPMMSRDLSGNWNAGHGVRGVTRFAGAPMRRGFQQRPPIVRWWLRLWSCIKVITTNGDVVNTIIFYQRLCARISTAAKALP
jgi:hypothetical protein